MEVKDYNKLTGVIEKLVKAEENRNSTLTAINKNFEEVKKLLIDIKGKLGTKQE